jgi:pyruvate dehydrogenase E2 component (dihydrolipoamide acetyltransferase)
MATEITMPKLSDTMTEGTLVSWKKGVGEKVERGDVVAEVETDKATMELEAFASGILLETRVKTGEVVPVGTVIAVIGEAGEQPAAAPAPPPVASGAETAETAPAAPVAHAEAAGEESRMPRAVTTPTTSAGVEVKASPLVRRLARERGIDLEGVRGSGPEGRILREDLDSTRERQGTETETAVGAEGKSAIPRDETPAPAGGGTSAPSGAGSQPLSGMRAAIARTVTLSWSSIPHFTVTAEIDMEAAELLHHGFKEAGHNVSLTDIIIKATARSLAEFPRLNASFTDGRITLHPEIHVGIAVDLEEGLLVPVVRNCEVLSLHEIALRSRELVERARTGRIREGDMSGGTFTVSNMGMFGTQAFTAIILPPQAGILAVGAVSDRTVVRNNVIAVGRMMSVTLSADHRVVDGAYGARFLRALKEDLENPVRLLV